MKERKQEKKKVGKCSVERTTLQVIHKEIVHKRITDLIL